MVAFTAAFYYLREGGKMFVNDEVIVPVSVAIGNFEMPEDIEGKLDELGAVRIPAGQIAREVGSPRSTNVVLVGALSTALPFSVEDWEDAISRRVPPKTVEANLEAFRQGRAELKTTLLKLKPRRSLFLTAQKKKFLRRKILKKK